jgi:hypothetical protein
MPPVNVPTSLAYQNRTQGMLIPDFRAFCDAAHTAGTIYDILGDYTLGLNLLGQGYDLTRHIGDDPRRARVCANLVRFLRYKKRFAEAEGRFIDGEKIAKRLDLPHTRAAIRAAYGSVLLNRNEPGAALPELVAAANWFAQAERVPALVRTWLDMVLAVYWAGYKSELDQALDGLDMYAVQVVTGYRTHYYLLYADLHVHIGNAEEAHRLTEFASKNEKQMENPWYL